MRPPCRVKPNVKKGLWTAEEDAKVLAYVSKHGAGNWTAVPKKAGLRRCGKSCRLRWTNYLRPDINHDNFTPQEEELIVRLHAAIGSRWSIIAQQLPGRTDNDVKNYWNTKLRKKLSEMGIDPVTHKPFSQILADYSNIGGLTKSGNRIGSLNRDLKNAFMPRSEKHPVPSMAAMVRPKVEPIQDSFLNSGNNSSDLLAQLQTIKLVTEASNCGNHETISAPPLPLQNEAPLASSSSSSSSSSSTCSTAAQEKSLLDFSWRNFLLEDEFLPCDPEEKDHNNVEFSSKDFADQTRNARPQDQITIYEATMQNDVRVQGMDSGAPRYRLQASSSSSVSFVEAILDQEKDMLMEFPNLLDESLYS